MHHRLVIFNRHNDRAAVLGRRHGNIRPAALRRSKQTRARPWVQELLKRRPPKVVAVALANKTARTAWAMMKTGEAYRTPKPAPR